MLWGVRPRKRHCILPQVAYIRPERPWGSQDRNAAFPSYENDFHGKAQALESHIRGVVSPISITGLGRAGQALRSQTGKAVPSCLWLATAGLNTP